MKERNPEISVIVATYNNFRWLRLILDSLREQSYKDFEVVIADDGSGEESVRNLQAYITAHPELRIVHSWHPDEGWRKNICLNNAVRASKGEYLIFIDGDCIPHPRFVEDHHRLRKEGVVTGGRRVESGKGLSAMIESWESLPADYFGKIRRGIFKGVFREKLGETIGQLRRTVRYPYLFGRPIGMKGRGILGANFGIWRKDLESVNGFDERYLHPGTGEDTDLDLRLANNGIRHQTTSHYALMVHRHHARLPMDSEENKELLRSVKENGTTYISTGLKKDENGDEGE